MVSVFHVIDLFRDVRGLAVEQGVVLPKYAGFKWHPLGRENQRWPLNTDGDWVIFRAVKIPQLDAFDSDVDENVEEQVEEYLESDSEDSYFNVDEHEESDEVLLDDESDDNEVLDDLDLELDTKQRMRLGHVDADGSHGHVVVTKKAKGIIKALKNFMPQASRRICVLHFYKNFTAHYPVELRRRGRLEKHHRRESASWAPVPQPEGQVTRHFSGTKRCKQCKQLGHTSLTRGRPRDESARLMEKYKKKRKTTTRLVGRPRKTLCTTSTLAGTSDPTSTATEGPHPNLVNLDCNILLLEVKCYEALQN
ncbi:hypothetical protein Cgig2_029235 [Carnegiea gigantea]|uniref:Transposase n=1 Tax=Carnegiea gigantea TaxID=171969 RepID=A0A9Q1GUR8_9CARY|nr:hypothetical protein Cgig2_029235 [Carnegiea gigantea]